MWGSPSDVSGEAGRAVGKTSDRVAAADLSIKERPDLIDQARDIVTVGVGLVG